jgi:L-lactate dehydrogenase complex protein LldG
VVGTAVAEMSARGEILRRVRAATADRRAAVAPIARRYQRNGQRAPQEILDLFAERVSEYRATVTACSRDDLATVLARAASAARVVAVPNDLDPAWLTSLDVPHEILRDSGQLSARQLDEADAVITASAVAIAETGSVVLDGSAGQGRRALTLVPDHHICVVSSNQVVETVPEALARLDPTRPLTFISGPSATSDIELDRVEGVHGPRQLDVVLVELDRQAPPFSDREG